MDRRSTSNVHCKAYLALGLTEISHECSGNQTALKITVGFGRKIVLVLLERSWGTNIGKVEEERGTESMPRERNRTDLTDFRILCFLGIGPMPKLEHEFSFLLCQPTYTLFFTLCPTQALLSPEDLSGYRSKKIYGGRCLVERMLSRNSVTRAR